MPESIETDSYKVTDPYFGAPYIDVDEQREAPYPHRHVHGGFADCDARFTFYFPDRSEWQGRMYMPLEGAHAGNEEAFGGPMGELMGGLGMTARLGGYMAETNMGHIGDDIDAKAGDDPTLYGWRAAAETGRFSKHVAAQVYGSEPHSSYVWGGSGGGRRSPLVLENAPEVFDGALPFMGGGDVRPFPATERISGAQVMSFACMFNVQRLLREPAKALGVIDAMQPGGSGDPFAGLNSHERDELASLYKQGFPFGNEFMIFSPMGQIWLWTSIADLLVEQDPTYFEKFWTSPGYVGHDIPEAVLPDLIDETVTVDRVITPKDLLTDPAFAGPEYMLMKAMAGIMAGDPARLEQPYAVQLSGLSGSGYRLGAGLQVVSGDAAGRQLYVMSHTGDVLVGGGHGDADKEKFAGVKAGDQIHVDNRKFLAFCYFHRHHIMNDSQFDGLRVGGKPIYAQHPIPLMSPLMGVSYTGHYSGKLLWVHHTHDSSLWPSQGIIYEGAVRGVQGASGAEARFRLQWTQNAEHIMPAWLPPSPLRASNTCLIDYTPVIEQGLVDLARWVEEDVAPASTSYQYVDGQVRLPATAAERGGVQPVVSVTANGGALATVSVGEPVTLSVQAETPAAGGTIVSVQWDFDGQGTYPYSDPSVDGTATSVTLTTTHTYDAPGTYFATALVSAHREGDVSAAHRRLQNLASARVIVR
jgi:hypothetical protein